MTHDDLWLFRYREIMDFMASNHRRPSTHDPEERLMHDWWKHNKKLMNAGKLKPDRIALFEGLLEEGKRLRRVNQFG